MPYRRHLSSSSDLVTTYEETRAGFVALALERTRRAVPYVDEARVLQVAAGVAKYARDLIKLSEIRPALIAAAGVSDKAANRLTEEDKNEAIRGLITAYLEPAGGNFVEELVFRFLLTKGDSLGGTMRNVAGVWGRNRVIRFLIAAFGLRSQPFDWLHAGSRQWISSAKNPPETEETVEALAWTVGARPRLMVFNKKPSFIGKNVDVCILECPPTQFASRKNDPLTYRALGELKGGFDPAGADEHWKTARTTLQRVRTQFSHHELSPDTFFIGGAIVPQMANEIWHQLEGKVLTNAANLTAQKQVASLSKWLAEI